MEVSAWHKNWQMVEQTKRRGKIYVLARWHTSKYNELNIYPR